MTITRFDMVRAFELLIADVPPYKNRPNLPPNKNHTVDAILELLPIARKMRSTSISTEEFFDLKNQAKSLNTGIGQSYIDSLINSLKGTHIARDNGLSSVERFFKLLDQVPRLRLFWDQDKCSLDIDALDKSIGVMSSGERYMAQFFTSVWEGNNERYGFDLIHMAPIVDPEWRQILIDWLADPFYP